MFPLTCCLLVITACPSLHSLLPPPLFILDEAFDKARQRQGSVGAKDLFWVTLETSNDTKRSLQLSQEGFPQRQRGSRESREGAKPLSGSQELGASLA